MILRPGSTIPPAANPQPAGSSLPAPGSQLQARSFRLPASCTLYPVSSAARRLHAMYNRLVETWGAQQWWPAQTPFEVVIGAYLTQNTAWKSVERSIANLRARGALSVRGLRAIPEAELRELIRPSGFMLRKAAALKAFVAFLDMHQSGRMANLRRPRSSRSCRRAPSTPGTPRCRPGNRRRHPPLRPGRSRHGRRRIPPPRRDPPRPRATARKIR